MPKPYVECFTKYGATLQNQNWAVSAKANDGSIVISCWEQFFSKPNQETLRYTDTLSRWLGNKQGNNLLREHLLLAQSQSLPIRLIVARTSNTQHIASGNDASKVSNKFHIKPEVVGSLIAFDGDEFIIDFKRA